jgi:hypothetical protein
VGKASHRVEGLAPGVYRAEASAQVGARPEQAFDLFLVRAASAELEEPAGRPEILEAVSVATGGRARGAADARPAALAFEPPRIVRVDRRADVELWSRPWLLAIALLLLGLEWGLRRRGGSL